MLVWCVVSVRRILGSSSFKPIRKPCIHLISSLPVVEKSPDFQYFLSFTQKSKCWFFEFLYWFYTWLAEVFNAHGKIVDNTYNGDNWLNRMNLYIYFAQSRHRQENTGFSSLYPPDDALILRNIYIEILLFFFKTYPSTPIISLWNYLKILVSESVQLL